ncbi:MAG TPA: Na+/H+ antiporter subunit D [Thermoanaerobaculia bacterium]|nr:Na+/H+ antiporter subunit D [Thermoanaerobaculia bacterium]
MNALLTLPIVIPMLGGAASLLAWRSRTVQRAIALVTSAALAGSTIALLVLVRADGIAVIDVGSWPAPFGIVLVADLFSALMLTVSAVIWFAVVIYSQASMDRGREAYGYYPLLSFLMMGVCGAFLTGDLFNLYVWFEVMLISSFVLMALGGERAQMESALKYVTLNLLSSALFLAGVGLLYSVTGMLNMAALAQRLGGVGQSGLVSAIAMLFLVAFGIKAAVFPLFFWLPASYHTPPAATSAIFAGLLTKVGVYALIRVFTLLFVQDIAFTHNLILTIAGLTMVTGVLGAVAQNEMRRILSFHIISQIGYMIMGLGLFTRFALAASIFYIVHHMVVKTNLFLVSGVVHRLRGTYELKDLGGLWRSNPLLGALFLIAAMSLSGIPPLSGFFAKLGLIIAGVDSRQFLIVTVALVTGFFTLFSMAKIWNEVFWKAAPGPAAGGSSVDLRMTLPIGALAAVTVAIGLGASWLFDVSMDAAAQMLDRNAYIEAVLR